MIRLVTHNLGLGEAYCVWIDYIHLRLGEVLEQMAKLWFQRRESNSRSESSVSSGKRIQEGRRCVISRSGGCR
jgi:hypothetical protein